MDPKSLQLPNGCRIDSDQVRHVRVFPERSRAFDCVYMEIYADDGLVYEGLVDLDRVVETQGGREKALRAVFDNGFVPTPLP